MSLKATRWILPLLVCVAFFALPHGFALASEVEVKFNDNVLIEVVNRDTMRVTVGNGAPSGDLEIKLCYLSLRPEDTTKSIVVRGNGGESAPIDLRLGYPGGPDFRIESHDSPIRLEDNARVKLRSATTNPVKLVCTGSGAGIEVTEGSELEFIDGTLELVQGGKGGAGIGGGHLQRTGKITISGGVIKEVLGSDSDHDGGGAGIGSGASSLKSDGSIILSGGVIEMAKGGKGAAGIGGGYASGLSSIIIQGGSLTALAGTHYGNSDRAAVGLGMDPFGLNPVSNDYRIEPPGDPAFGYSYWCGTSAGSYVEVGSHLQVQTDIVGYPFKNNPYLRVQYGPIPPTSSQAPKTGDAADPTLWTVLALGALMMGTGSLVIKKRQKASGVRSPK